MIDCNYCVVNGDYINKLVSGVHYLVGLSLDRCNLST